MRLNFSVKHVQTVILFTYMKHFAKKLAYTLTTVLFLDNTFVSQLNLSQLSSSVAAESRQLLV